MSYASTPFAISTVATAKLSILSLYRRLFSTHFFQLASLIVGVFVIIYWIISVLGFIFLCIPIQAAWQKTPGSKCVDDGAFFLGLELLNCVLDLTMLWLALKVVRGLQLQLKQKIGLAMIFMLGSWYAKCPNHGRIEVFAYRGSVLIVGIVRLALVYSPNAPRCDTHAWNCINTLRQLPVAPSVITAILENGIAILCACLPIYKPIWTQCLALFSKIRSQSPSISSSVGAWRGAPSKSIATLKSSSERPDFQRSSYHEIHDGENTAAKATREATIKGNGTDRGIYALDNIRVQNEIDIV